MEGQREKRIPLAALRGRLREAQDAEALRSLERQLREDERSGARTLARTCARRLETMAAERERLEGLFALRRSLRSRGARAVAGVDEVGMGPLAGPVVAAAVILPDAVDLRGLNDSKRLLPAQREVLAARIRESARAFSVAEVSPGDVDRLNVYHAGLEAMRRAVAGLELQPDHLLVDARRIPGLDLPQTSLVRGDARDGSIAAASILAKVHRDTLMQRLDAEYPAYGFARHKGYPTPDHLAALQRHGPTPLHRRSFAPVAQLFLR